MPGGGLGSAPPAEAGRPVLLLLLLLLLLTRCDQHFCPLGLFEVEGLIASTLLLLYPQELRLPLLHLGGVTRDYS